MATELVNLATNEKLAEIDWSKNIEICEIVARDRRQAKDVVKAIKKRLGSKDPTAQLYAVMLLEMLMNNIGEPVHEQVIDAGVLPALVKIVKKKTDLPVRERIFLLLDATQTSVGGAKGKFPQYYTAYYDLVSAGVQFPQRPREAPPKNTNHQTSREAPPKNTNHQTSQVNKKTTLNGELAAARKEVVTQKAEPQTVPESSIIQKATNALEVLKEVLDAVDPQNPEGARDEFTLDLVEQCSFQKQRVMHLVISSRDENLVSRAIELNEQLQKILTRHDDLLSGRPTLSERSTLSDRTTSSGNQFNHIEMEDEDDEEEAEQLFRRLRKGKACAKSEDEQDPDERVRLGLLASSIQGDRLNRPLIRSVDENSREAISHPAAVVIPPPPSKHAEREKFFQEKKVDGAAISGHMRGLSLHSRNGSSCRSESTDYSE